MCDAGADPGFGRGGQLPNLKFADIAERSRSRKASNLGSRANLRALKILGFNAQICILPHSRDSFSNFCCVCNVCVYVMYV